MQHHRLQQWLSSLDTLPLECDGLTRVISTLLEREGISHQAYVGEMSVHGMGIIRPHYWIDLADGVRCDFRARMWLGQDERVPHGVFQAGSAADYTGVPVNASLHPMVFQILSNHSLDTFPAFGKASPVRHQRPC